MIAYALVIFCSFTVISFRHAPNTVQYWSGKLNIARGKDFEIEYIKYSKSQFLNCQIMGQSAVNTKSVGRLAAFMCVSVC